MEIYLAARYSRIDELNGYAEELRKEGHTVPARWLLGEHQIHENVDLIEQETLSVPIEGRPFAQDDLADVLSADAVISFTETPRSGHSRGGRHVEFGIALAMNKLLVVVGPRENVFHTLPQVAHFWAWGRKVTEHLKSWEVVPGWAGQAVTDNLTLWRAWSHHDLWRITATKDWQPAFGTTEDMLALARLILEHFDGEERL